MTLCKFELIRANILELPPEKIARLRSMTLPLSESDNSYMRDTLDEPISVLSQVEVAIAETPEEELGWSMIRPYYRERLIQVFVKSKYRRHNVGTRLFQALNDGGKDIVGGAWNHRSKEFFKSLRTNYFWSP